MNTSYIEILNMIDMLKSIEILTSISLLQSMSLSFFFAQYSSRDIFNNNYMQYFYRTESFAYEA